MRRSVTVVHSEDWQRSVACVAHRHCVLGYHGVSDGVPRVDLGAPAPQSPLNVEGVTRWLAGEHNGGRLVQAVAHGVDLCYEGMLPTGRLPNSVEEEFEEAVEAKLLQEVEAGVLAVVQPAIARDFTELMATTNMIVRAVQEPSKVRKLHDASAKRRVGGQLVRTGVNGAVQLDAMGDCPLHGVADVAAAVLELTARWGTAPKLIVYDYKSAYRQFGVRAADIPSQLLYYKGVAMWDTRLGMGHRASAHWCAQFSAAVAAAVERVLGNVARVLRYLDDHIILVRPDMAAFASAAFEIILRDIGMPLAANKTTTPAYEAKWLGFIHNSVRQVHAVPPDKLFKLLGSLNDMAGASRRGGAAQRDKLQSLAGQLADITKVFQAGKPFLRNVFDAVNVPASCDWQELRDDLAWWAALLPRLDTVARMRRPPEPNMPVVELDASLWGGGAVLWAGTRVGPGLGVWWRWPAPLVADAESGDMPFLEAVTVLVGLHLALSAPWGSGLRGGQLRIRSDCMGVIHAVRGAASRNRGLQRVIRAVFSTMLTRDVQVLTTHVPSAQNIADPLSRVPAPDGNRAALDETLYRDVRLVPLGLDHGVVARWRTAYRGATSAGSA